MQLDKEAQSVACVGGPSNTQIVRCKYRMFEFARINSAELELPSNMILDVLFVSLLGKINMW